MYLISSEGNYLLNKDKWCFIADLPLIYELAHFSNIVNNNLCLSDLSHCNTIPNDLETQLIRKIQKEPELSVSELSIEKALKRAVNSDIRLSEYVDIQGYGGNFLALCQKYGGIREQHAFIINSGIKGGVNCAPPDLLQSLLLKLNEFMGNASKNHFLAATLVASIYFLMLHPLKDQNGRAMRAYLGSKLYEYCQNSGFPVFLGPLWIAYNQVTSNWMLQLQINGGWDVMIYRMCRLITYYAELAVGFGVNTGFDKHKLM